MPVSLTMTGECNKISKSNDNIVTLPLPSVATNVLSCVLKASQS